MTPRKPQRAKQLGVSDEEYERLLAAQGGHCALCPNTPKTKHHPTKPWTCRYCEHGNSAADDTCGNCGLPRPKPPRLHVDHDHATGKVRGLLCYVCNKYLPASRDADWHLRAAEYLTPAVDVERLTAGGNFALGTRYVRVEDWRAAAERASRDPRSA